MGFLVEQLNTFADAWEESCGERLSPGEAAVQLQRLAALYRAISRPLPQDVRDDRDVPQRSRQQAA